MDEIAPSKYLSLLLNNTPPSMTDLNTLNKLSAGYKLGNGIINVIVDYVMEKNNNVLSYPFCDKVASILVSRNIETAVDAMNVLNELSNKDKQKKVSQPTYKVNKEKVVEEAKPSEVESVSDEEMNEIFDMLENLKKEARK